MGKTATNGAEPRTSEKSQDGGLGFYEEPVKRLMQAIDQGVCPWNNPCLSLPIANAKSGLTYRGFNQVYLAVITMMEGHRSPFWMTLRQANEFGGHVKKGEHSSMIVYRKMFEAKGREAKKEETSGGARDGDPATEKVRRYPRLFYFRVFNFDQTDGVEIGREPYPTVRRTATPDEAEATARAMLADMKDGPIINHDKSIVSRSAGSYAEKSDTISLRPPEDYPTAGEYWSTLFHELVHAAGAAKRLDFHKGASRPRFGDRDYALEELTAEIGANFLLVRAGLENAELRDNSAAYLRSWKSKIENNPKVLIWASERAARAVNLVLGIVPEKPKEVVESGTSPETEASQPMPLPPVVAMEAVLETEVVPPTAAAVPSMG